MSKDKFGEVKVGRQPINVYAMSIIRALKSNVTVHVLARGVNIGKAVISTQLARRTLDGINIDKIDVYDEDITFPDRDDSTKTYTKTLTCVKIVVSKK